MRTIDWKVEYRNLLGVVFVAGAVGWPFGLHLWCMLGVALIYVGWTIKELKRIQQWLKHGDGAPPPESRGVFGAILDDVYRLQRLGQEERKKIEAQLKFLEDSFAALPDAAVMLDAAGAINWCNRASARLLGLRYPSDKGRQLTNLIRNPSFVSYFDRRQYYEPLQMRSPADDSVQLQVNITYFGERSRLILVRDITQTNRLLQMRKDFVANVSHELRTPLTVITGYLETLADNGSANEMLWRKAVAQMLLQSRRMETLIKDLIVLSRLESAPEAAAHETIDLAPMLTIVREEALAAVSEGRDVQIEIDCDRQLLLQGNPNEIHSAINNLVVNAAKYCGDNGRITIRWYRDASAAYLSVEDNGAGIEAHHIPRLTERFYRVDKSRSIETGGTGLGLAIVKHILVHHQAELRIKSVLGVGSTFTCVFPLNRIPSCSRSA